jgi:TrmH family RNA methyltransferase
VKPLSITSAHNPRIKAAVRLRDSKERRKTGRFLIDGGKEILRAIRAGIQVAQAFVCHELCTTAERKEAAQLAMAASLETYHVSAEVFSKLAFGGRAEGVVIVAVAPRRNLEQLVLPENPLVAVLEGVEKPGNLGAVLRSADGAGFSAVVAADSGHDLYNPNAIRASLGAIFTLPVCVAGSPATLNWLRARKLTIYAARVGAGRLYTEAEFTRPAAILLGSEAHGLTEFWRGEDIYDIELPMRGSVDSLNVSAAAAILFYEAQRQRTQPAAHSFSET